MLQPQIGATRDHAPLKLARERGAATIHDARRAIAKHILRRLDNLWVEHIIEIDTEREVADALEVGVEFGRGLRG